MCGRSKLHMADIKKAAAPTPRIYCSAEDELNAGCHFSGFQIQLIAYIFIIDAA